MNQKIKDKFSYDEIKSMIIVLAGNFLEYFDVMLFTHLSFVITPLFLPKTDPTVAKFLSILAFSSSFIIKPFGAYFWGMIGDKYGRVKVLTYTTLIMAGTCLVIPNIPTYAQWGFYSTFLMMLCRTLQGFSSTGESKCAEVYITETLPLTSKVFLASVLIPITCDLGGFFASLMGSLCLTFMPQDGWKFAFYIGAVIAVCATFARLHLTESEEFKTSQKTLDTEEAHLQMYFEKRNFLALLGMNVICPTAFYFAFSVCSDIMSEKLGMSPSTILFSNGFLMFAEIIFLYICARFTVNYHPFKILRVRTWVSFVLMPLTFWIMMNNMSHLTIFLAQVVAILATASFDPAAPLVIRSFHASNRFSQYSKAAGITKALMYLSTGYLTHYFSEIFGVWAVLGLLMFFSAFFLISLNLFVPIDEMRKTFIKLIDQNQEKPGNVFVQTFDGLSKHFKKSA